MIPLTTALLMFSKQTPAIYGMTPRRGPNGDPTVGQVMAVGEDGAFEWSDIPEPDLSGYATLAGWQPGGILVSDGSGDLALSPVAASKLGYLDVSTLGTVEANKVVTADANRDVTNIRNLSLTGQLNLNAVDPTSNIINCPTSRLLVRIAGADRYQFGNGGLLALYDGIAVGSSLAVPHGGFRSQGVANRTYICGQNINGGTAIVGIGGPGASYPALKNNGTVLESRLADDSAYAGFRADYLLIGGDSFFSRKAAGHFRAGTTLTGEDAALTIGSLVTTLNVDHILRGSVSIGKATAPTSTLDVSGTIRGNGIHAAIDGTVDSVAVRLNDIDTGFFKPIANVIGFAAGGVVAGRMDGDATAGNTRLLIWDVNSGALARVKVGANGTGPGGVGRALYFDNV